MMRALRPYAPVLCWGVLLLFLAGCDGSVTEMVLELILVFFAFLLAAAVSILIAMIGGGGVVFVSAVIATYTHIRPTPLMRVLATIAGVLLSLLGILLVVAGFTTPSEDSHGMDALRAAGPWLYAGAVALWLGIWNLLAALKLLRKLLGEEDAAEDAVQSLAEHF